MAAPRLRHGLCFVACFFLAAPILVFAQGTPLTLGPLNVVAPPGWIAQTNTVPVRIFSPDSTPQQYFQVEFQPFIQTTQDVRDDHAQFWGRMAAMIRAASQPQSGVSGQFIWTRIDAQRAPGQVDTVMLYSTKVGSTYIPVTVDATNATIFARNFRAFDAMMRGGLLANAAPPAASAPNPGASNSAGPPPGAGSPASLSDYGYAVPQGWTANQYSDGIVLMSPTSATNERCVVTLWPMRAAGADLLADANNMFQEVYRDYQLTNQTVRGTLMPSGIVRGTSGQGWDYVIVRRGIAPRGSPESRLGFVMVAKLNNRLAVISGVSRDPLVSTCFGELVHDAWPRFFYSLSFKNWTPTDQGAAMRRRIAGVWISATATAGSHFTFGANGRYSDVAARQQYERISNSEVLATTTGFAGNGAYTLRGNSITLTPDAQRNRSETGFIRVEEESKDEGRTWVESLYLLRTSAIDGKEYEVKYQRTR